MPLFRMKVRGTLLTKLSICLLLCGGLEAWSESLADYPLERTIEIIEASPEGYLTFSPFNSETPEGKDTSQNFKAIHQIVAKLYPKFKEDALQNKNIDNTDLKLVFVSPETTMEVEVGLGWMGIGERFAKLPLNDYQQLQLIIQKQNSISKREPVSRLKDAISHHQRSFIEEQLPLPLLDSSAPDEDQGPFNDTMEVQRLIIQDGSDKPIRTEPAQQSTTKINVPKKVNTLIVKDETPDPNLNKVKVKLAKDGEIIDQRTSKPESKKSSGTQLSPQDLQMIYIFLGLCLLIGLIAVLNRFANRDKRKSKGGI